MKLIYFTLALIPLLGISIVSGQCNGNGPSAWKKPESCCKFNLIEQSILKGCKGSGRGDSVGHGGGGNGGRGGHGGGGGSGPKRPGDIIKGSCLLECAFNSTGLYNGALVEAQIRSVFTNAVSGNVGLTTALNSALGTCLPIANSRAAEFTAKLTSGESKCDPISIFLFVCVTSNLVANCPAADFEANDPTCVTMQTYYKQCPNGPQ